MASDKQTKADKKPGKPSKGTKKAPSTAFKPGESGNPKGRPPKGYSLAEFVRAKLEDNDGEKLTQVFTALYQKAIDPDGPVTAAQELLTRAYGKPIDTVKMDVTTQHSDAPDEVKDLWRHISANTSVSGPVKPKP